MGNDSIFLYDMFNFHKLITFSWNLFKAREITIAEVMFLCWCYGICIHVCRIWLVESLHKKVTHTLKD